MLGPDAAVLGLEMSVPCPETRISGLEREVSLEVLSELSGGEAVLLALSQ